MWLLFVIFALYSVGEKSSPKLQHFISKAKETQWQRMNVKNAAWLWTQPVQNVMRRSWMTPWPWKMAQKCKSQNAPTAMAKSNRRCVVVKIWAVPSSRIWKGKKYFTTKSPRRQEKICVFVVSFCCGWSALGCDRFIFSAAIPFNWGNSPCHSGRIYSAW